MLTLIKSNQNTKLGLLNNSIYHYSLKEYSIWIQIDIPCSSPLYRNLKIKFSPFPSSYLNVEVFEIE